MNFKRLQKTLRGFLAVLTVFSIFCFLLAARTEAQPPLMPEDDPTTFNIDESVPLNLNPDIEPEFEEIPAQNETPTVINIRCPGGFNYPWCQEGVTTPSGFISRFYQIALGLVGAAALGVLIYGAILWSVSGAVSTKQDAMQWISAALWGLALLLASYLILRTINPELVKLGSGETLFGPIYESVTETQQEDQNQLDQGECVRVSEWCQYQMKHFCKPEGWDGMTKEERKEYCRTHESLIIKL